MIDYILRLLTVDCCIAAVSGGEGLDLRSHRPQRNSEVRYRDHLTNWIKCVNIKWMQEARLSTSVAHPDPDHVAGSESGISPPFPDQDPAPRGYTYLFSLTPDLNL